MIDALLASRRMPLALAASALLHAALWLLWLRPATAPTAAQAPVVIHLRLQAAVVVESRATGLDTAAVPAPTAPAAAMPLSRRARVVTRPSLQAPQSEAVPVEPIRAAAAAAAPQAPASPAEPLRLDSAVIKQAVREAAASAPAAELAVAAGRPLRAPGAEQRLADGMADSAHGDCSKGGYTGAGMGLLSLPFLAVAELSGRCAR